MSSPIEDAAMRYAQATAEITRLTKQLGMCDHDTGAPVLVCSTPMVDPRSQTWSSCRKWTYQPDGESVGGWSSERERADWCGPCKAIQAIVDQRRAARRLRAGTLAAIGNMGRAMLRAQGIAVKEASGG